MEGKTEWVELRITSYEDGKFEAYEALTGRLCGGSWEAVRNWAENILAETETEIKGRQGR